MSKYQNCLPSNLTRRLVERFLLDNYKPHQLSTYALTLYDYKFKDTDGSERQIGVFVMVQACRMVAHLLACEGEGLKAARSSESLHAHTCMCTFYTPQPMVHYTHRHLGHGRPGALQQHPRLLLLPCPCVHHGVRRHSQSDLQEPRQMVRLTAVVQFVVCYCVHHLTVTSNVSVSIALLTHNRTLSTNRYAELQEHCKGVPTILVANKIDVDYKV